MMLKITKIIGVVLIALFLFGCSHQSDNLTLKTPSNEQLQKFIAKNSIDPMDIKSSGLSTVVTISTR